MNGFFNYEDVDQQITSQQIASSQANSSMPDDMQKKDVVEKMVSEILAKKQAEQQKIEEENRQKMEAEQSAKNFQDRRKAGLDYFKNLDDAHKKQVDKIASSLMSLSNATDRNFVLSYIKDDLVSQIQGKNQNASQKDIYDYLENEFTENRYKYIFDETEANNSKENMINNFSNYINNKNNQPNNEGNKMNNQNFNNSMSQKPINSSIDTYSMGDDQEVEKKDALIFKSDEDLSETIKALKNTEELAATISGYVPPRSLNDNLDSKGRVVFEPSTFDFIREKQSNMQMRNIFMKNIDIAIKAVRQDLNAVNKIEKIKEQWRNLEKTLGHSSHSKQQKDFLTRMNNLVR